jgi:hypothetical protein
MECSIRIINDYAVVKSDRSELGTLKLDMSLPCCRVFETAKQQSRDCLDELIEWCGEAPSNFDAIANSIYMYLLVRRREAGLCS